MGARFLRIYIVPGAVLQSVMIGGGYGTGREIVEFFTRFGSLGGVLGLLVAALGFAVVLALTYDIARRWSLYDYRSFLKRLIGPAWFAYEALYLVLFIIILAVVAAAFGEMLTARLGVTPAAGAAVVLVLAVLLTFRGRDLVLRALTAWAVLLSAIFLTYFVLVALRNHEAIARALTSGALQFEGVIGGLQYVLYNVALAPALLFSARAIETRAQAWSAGAIASLAVVVPALFFHLSYTAALPEILAEPLPTYRIIDSLALPWFMALYALGLLGTLVQTGVGIIHGLIERVDAWRMERGRDALGSWSRAGFALISIAVSLALSSVGVVALIARGYGALAWGFLFVYVLPLLVMSVRLWARSQTIPYSAWMSRRG